MKVWPHLPWTFRHSKNTKNDTGWYMKFRWLCVWLALLLAAPAIGRESTSAQAKCLVRANEPNAKAFARSIPGSDEERQMLYVMSHDLSRCADQAALMSDDILLLGGAIAERELKKTSRTVISRRFRGFDPQEMDSLGVSERTLERTQAWPPLVAALFCANTRDPRSAAAILKASPKSKAENKAVEQFTPAITRCLDKGKALALNPPKIRAVLARFEYGSSSIPTH
ncbi:hypothetical protein HNO88_001086 [Novosphingobium chloroacetimidivorans]|uniref:Uncharacterized protein n=1 Tax=Novosphingobium chloroacetimidivorans TaxID=1428314 RepID=A0A7W7K880_9SPHN|nr:hypothetical protein [Novosphingobium chloroacetimidivorans]